MRNVYEWFAKIATNEYRAFTLDKEGKKVPMLYRREDLSNWAEEAFNKNKDYFYAEPVNPDDPYGKLQLCEPKYTYVLRHSLTKEELDELFGEEVYVSVKDYYSKK